MTKNGRHLCGAAIEDVRDIRMIQARQNLAFAAKPLFHRLGQQSGADHFYGNPFAERTVDARPFVYGAHATAPDLADHFIGANAGGDEVLAKRWGIRQNRKRPIHETGGKGVRGKQPVNFFDQRRVRLAKPLQHSVAMVWWKVDHRLKNRADLLQPVWRHDGRQSLSERAPYGTL